MVRSIRNIEQALGDELKTISPSERKNMIVARKSIIAACPITKGELFTEQNITVKRPGNGISSMRWEEIIGEAAIRNFEEDELIEI
jgi:N,N'-diacetyllegionaminate synthase